MTGGALLALGVGDGGATAGNGFLISQKSASSGDACVWSNQAGTTGRLLHITHNATATSSPCVFLETTNGSGTTSRLLQLTANGTPGTGTMLLAVTSSVLSTNGFSGDLLRVYGDSSGILDVVGTGTTLRLNGASLLIQGPDNAASGNWGRITAQGGATNIAAVSQQFRAWSGSGTSYYSTQFVTSGSAGLVVQCSNGAQAIGSETWQSVVNFKGSGGAALIGFFGAAAVVKQTAAATTTGFTAGGGTAVDSAATFTGGIGATAYTIGDIVKALKAYGLLTS